MDRDSAVAVYCDGREPVGRFSDMEEDEPAAFPLCNEHGAPPPR